MRHEDFCQKWMNSRPVIFISLKDAKGKNFEDAYKKLEKKIFDQYNLFSSIFKDINLFDIDKRFFEELKSGTSDIADFQTSLKNLMMILYSFYGKKVIVLIDDYDVPLTKAMEKNSSENNFYTRMQEVMRGFMNCSLKDNEFLDFAVLTGNLPVTDESIFGRNCVVPYTILDDRFSEYFGFTESEVDAMLAEADRQEAASAIKEWYDGYVFGTSHVYCPWDVINYLSALAKHPDARPKAFWKDSSHNGILRTFAERTEFSVSDKFEALMNGGTVTQTITDMLTYDTLHASEDNMWSVLLMTGYITKVNPDSDEDTVQLKIPNKEVAMIFRDAVVSLFRDTIDNVQQKAMMEALWAGDEDAASKTVSDFLWKTISYNDYHEDYYHAFLAGIFTGLGYEVESNKEKGLGRPDIILKDKKNRRAIIIEAKKSASRTDMEADCGRALEQIDTKKYAEGLYGYTQVLCYGVAFFQKEALVRKK